MTLYRLSKMIIFSFFAILLFSTIGTTKAYAVFSGSGAGTSGDPFQITSVSELLEINDYLGSSNSNVYWKLMNNLDLSAYNTGSGWDPIGSSASSAQYFYGKFDGNYKTITNLFIDRSAESYIGLFAYGATGSLFENLYITNVTITATTGIGSLVGSTSGTTRNVGVENVTISGLMRAGGVIGENRGAATRLFARTGTITQRAAATHCCIGGITGGTEFGGSLSDSYARIAVVHTLDGQSGIGGAVGNTYNSAGIARIYSTGSVSSLDGTPPSNIGGLIGNNYVAATASYWDTETSGTAISASGTGKTTAQMKDQSTYSGWDFATIWSISPSVNNGYPALQWESTAPLVTTLSPTDNATGVALDANLVITFNEAITIGTGNVTIYNASDDSVFEAIDVTSGKVTGGGTTTITINPANTFASGAQYYVQIANTAFKDADTNAYAGISDSTSWNFTGIDTDNPLISTLSPTNGATDIGISSNLVITFNEAVNVESGNIIIKKSSDNTTVDTIDVTSGEVTGDGTTTITINPTTNLFPETQYYIQIDATAFDDIAGNSFAGIADTTTWVFTTAAASSQTKITISPSPVSVTENGGTQTITFTLTEPLIADPEGATIYLSSSDTSEFTLSTSSISWAQNADWSEARSVTITAINDDTIGNNLGTLAWNISTSAAFYQGLAGSISITLIDDDTATSTKPSVRRSFIPAQPKKILSTLVSKITTSSSPSTSFKGLYRLGNRGATVTSIQNALNKTEMFKEMLDTDGIFGPLTTQAVKHFQEKKNIDVDGIVGPQTWGLLSDVQ